MQSLKKFFRVFFQTLGVIFFILIILGIYLWKADPFNFKDFLGNVSLPLNFSADPANSNYNGDANSLLNQEQENILRSAGIDPASLPSSISPEMEKCFAEKLGQDRVDEIKAGAEPGMIDLYKANSCL